jgi:hypothetical protein
VTTLWEWALCLAFTVGGLAALALAAFLSWGGTALLIAPVLFGLAVVSGAIFAGLRSPGWAVTLFALVEVGFIVVHFVNPFGLGAIL